MKSNDEKLEWLEFDLLHPFNHVSHGVFLRHLDLSIVGQLPNEVHANRELVRKKVEANNLVFPHQVHGSHVERVTSKNIGRTPHADAIFTTEKNLALGVTHADCQAAIFYDPVHEAIAVVHAGWKGLANYIYARTFEAMQRDIGTQPQNHLVCISPSLAPDCAEFKNYKQELPQEFWSFQSKPNHFDLWAIAKKQLTSLGILEKNIEVAEVCTHCHPKEYFSYRREKDTARHGTIVALKG